MRLGTAIAAGLAGMIVIVMFPGGLIGLMEAIIGGLVVLDIERKTR